MFLHSNLVPLFYGSTLRLSLLVLTAACGSDEEPGNAASGETSTASGDAIVGYDNGSPGTTGEDGVSSPPGDGSSDGGQDGVTSGDSQQVGEDGLGTEEDGGFWATADIEAAGPDTLPPTVSMTTPENQESGVPINANVTVTFSEPMDAETLTSATVFLALGDTAIPATISLLGTVAVLDPTAHLAANSLFTVTVLNSVTDVAGNPMDDHAIWTFTTGTEVSKGPAPVNLGTAGNFVILAKSGISTVPPSVINGDIGVSPIDSTAMTGFSMTMDITCTFSTSEQVNGRAYAADHTPPTPSNLTAAISNMEVAFTDAAGRATPSFVELGSGEIGGLTLVPGLYKWGTGVFLSNDVTFAGGPNDVWILQISGGITQASDVRVLLSGGARAKNIFWQTFGAVALGTGTHFEGIIISQTEITLATGATANGRFLSHTAVTLDSATVSEPEP